GFHVEVAANLLHIDTDFSLARKGKQRNSSGMGNVERDIARMRWPQRRFFFLGVGEAQAARIRCQVACQDCPQKGPRGNKALTVPEKMKAGSALQFVGGKRLLPTGFVGTDSLQIDSPELHFGFG